MKVFCLKFRIFSGIGLGIAIWFVNTPWPAEILFTVLFFGQADLEGVPEVTVNILSHALDYLVVHPSVQQGDTDLQELTSRQSEGFSTGRKLRFRPPSDPFTLCHYSATVEDGLPIKAIYQMKVLRGLQCVAQSYVHYISDVLRSYFRKRLNGHTV